jgi:MFS family permease
MTRVVNEHLVDRDQLIELQTARSDWLVHEVAVEGDVSASNRPTATLAGQTSHTFTDGPFTHWERTIEAQPTTESGERFAVTETIDFRLALPGFRFAAAPLLAWQLRRPHRVEAPFWAPPERFDTKGAQTFGLLIFAVMAAAYLGTLLSQTITFVAEEFDKGTSTQGWITSMTRGGALLALVVVRYGDRLGRRKMLLFSGTLSTAFAVSAAFSPNIWFFGASQTISRGFATGFALLIGVIAAEESPAGSRAWITSVLALFAGLGSGMVLWLLPVAGTGERGWRIIFLVAVLAFPVLWGLRGRLEESRRFDALVERDQAPAAITPIMKRRFFMLAAVSFALSMFSAPSSNFQNEYLRETRGFSATRISLFSAVVSTPIGIGVAIAGPQADRRGRRLVGIIGILGGVLFAVVRYGVAGPLMWIAGGLGTIIGAATIPALGVYGPELFPTSRRGLANGLLTCVGVVGSVIGLVFVGQATERLGWSFSQSFTLLAIAPLLAILVVSRYPETAQRALEELNPEDSSADPASPADRSG